MLFLSIPKKDIAFWATVLLFTDLWLMFLSANCIGKSDHAYYESDQQLRLQAKDFVDELSQLSRHDGILAAQRAYTELDRHVERLTHGARDDSVLRALDPMM
ncbi:hypothetical protein ColKHC_14327 [Colletotrichum higginsianum]|nr:hypothetical protein ColKHC_14327 [Colletotrichum higginsianum]